MSQILNKHIIKCLIDTLIDLEFAEENSIDDDFAVELLEQISADLQTISNADKVVVTKAIEDLSKSYPNIVSDFVRKLPHTLGISR